MVDVLAGALQTVAPSTKVLAVVVAIRGSALVKMSLMFSAEGTCRTFISSRWMHSWMKKCSRRMCLVPVVHPTALAMRIAAWLSARMTVGSLLFPSYCGACCEGAALLLIDD